MGDVTTRGPVLVDGDLALVVDATVAALCRRGVDARTHAGDVRVEPLPADTRFLLLLVPGRAEAAFRAGWTAATTGLAWGAIVEGPTPVVTEFLEDTGASWVLAADAGLDAVLQALGREDPRRPASQTRPEPAGAPAGSGPSAASRLASLSVEERTVLDAMAEGRSVPETGRILGSTVATVREHRRAVRRKLGVRSQLAAVALLFRQDAEDAAAAPTVAPAGQAPR